MMIKSWTWLVVAGITIVVLGFALVWLVGLLLRSNRTDVQTTLPLVPEQKVDLAADGETVLQIEMPRIETDYRRLQLEITDATSGKSITMANDSGRPSGVVYGITTMKVPIGRMTVSQPGRYTVRVTGMAADKSYSTYRLLLSRPYLARIALQIVGIALCGVGMLLSLLWGLWLMGVLKSGSSS
jgi:hypothetical protein